MSKKFILSYYVDITTNTLIDNPYKKWWEFWKDSKILSAYNVAMRNHIVLSANSYKDIDVIELKSTYGDGYNLQIEELQESTSYMEVIK